MKVLIFAQYFFTPEQAGSARLMELGGRLAAEGHEVTLVTSMVDNAVRVVPERFRRRLWVREELEGLQLLRVWSYPNYQGSMKRRLVHYATFNMTSLLALLERGQFDLVLATSPPLPVGLSGWMASRARRARFVFEVRDLWPHAAVQVGALREGLVLRALEGMERFLYRSADRLIALTPGIRRYLVDAGVPEDRIELVTNGFDPAQFEDMPAPAEARRKLGLEGEFLVMLAGTLGPSMKLEIMLQAADRLRDRPEIRFAFVGDGDARPSLERRAAELRLDNVSFRDPVPRRELGTLYAAADLLFCHVARFYADVALPNRFLDYLGAGKPILTSGTGDMADAMKHCGAGKVMQPGDVDGMVQAIREIYENREEFSAAARRGVPEAIRRFSWNSVYGDYRRALGRAVGHPQEAQPAYQERS